MKLIINESKCFIVYSKVYWNKTGIEIEIGETYTFEAEGAWTDLFKTTDADGYTNLYMSLYTKLKRSGKNKWFSLIGSVNKSSNYLIGKRSVISFRESGILYLFANDVPLFYWNNKGFVELKITRVN